MKEIRDGLRSGESSNLDGESPARPSPAFSYLIFVFDIPEVVRKNNTELDTEARNLETRVCQIYARSQELVGIDEERIRSYLEDRDKFVNDATAFIKQCRAFTKNSRVLVKGPAEEENLDHKVLHEAREALEELEMALLKERSAFAANHLKLEFELLSHAARSRVGNAYLASSKSLRRQKLINRDAYANFTKRLRKAYNGPDYDDPTRPWSWAKDVRATHILPCGVGEANAVYLFGLDRDQRYETIWGTRNGLLLYDEIEKQFDQGNIVIVPDGANKGELKAVVLDETILSWDRPEPSVLGYVCFCDIHDRRLEFKTDARPDRRYLYLHCLLSVFRRRRLNAKGWEKDYQKVATEKVWGSPGKWVRRSIVRALAHEREGGADGGGD
ncbi:hypothetical protein H2201_004423 [Coniosporium apollinis]|uniref:HNH nuclease domain-containing protein n=1 Tax=Coniosporium apollinis TaxID=61459 RepID=A0ABQ9NWZ3_9PEZI|nr:hypothetical protein H2201_004423 [Coniosporium apollinis]